MNLDHDGLPVTLEADGSLNPADQLQRLGMIAAGEELSGIKFDAMKRDALEALIGLHAGRGEFRRHGLGKLTDVSADQLISALAALVICDIKDLAEDMTGAMLDRNGFAQNIHDGLNGDHTKLKIPDFMFFRASPLICRINLWLYPLALIFDLFLVIMAISAVIYAKRSPDNVDQNNTILTIAVCSKKFETPWSWLARKIFGKFLPYNFGCGGLPECPARHPVIGSLLWYHRAPAGNPEIAELWRPICKRYFE
jgi:hypothetical protein